MNAVNQLTLPVSMSSQQANLENVLCMQLVLVCFKRMRNAKVFRSQWLHGRYWMLKVEHFAEVQLHFWHRVTVGK